ncbi:MAG: serine hydrolase domain-containing protein [Acidobacteriota bacterium]
MLRRSLLSLAFAPLTRNNIAPLEKLLLTAAAQSRPRAAVLLIRERNFNYLRAFGAAQPDSRFLIASITKPMTAATLLSLGKVDPSQPASRYLPELTGPERAAITIRQLLTHTSGLPDMLPENTALRQRHAPLSEFVRLSFTTPLLFAPGTRYSYSSTGILLAAVIAERLGGQPLPALMQRQLFQPLNMKHSTLGAGSLPLSAFEPIQVEHAPSDLGNSAETRSWDWNSPYWRNLASPWGGAHSTAADIAAFLESFFAARLGPGLAPMIQNQNPAPLTPHGLGWSLGPRLGPGLAPTTFGHGGSTGTLCWADPTRRRVFVLLTSLPANVSNSTVLQPASRLAS